MKNSPAATPAPTPAPQPPRVPPGAGTWRDHGDRWEPLDEAAQAAAAAIAPPPAQD